MTIILIAHRLSTVKECKLIYLLDQGKLEAKGSYSELKESCELFQNMLKTDSQL
jgi:ABC-type multidrug transport system fused ATPase/permease subunit